MKKLAFNLQSNGFDMCNNVVTQFNYHLNVLYSRIKRQSRTDPSDYWCKLMLDLYINIKVMKSLGLKKTKFK